ncbi:MAG: hypothetical protein WC551_09080 [Patescibacteria group bacterium]
MSQPIFTMRTMIDKMTNLRLNETPARVRKGLTKAGELLLRDAVTSDPAMPVDTTSLIGSGTVFVDGVKVFESPYGVPGTQTKYPQYAPREYQDFRASEDEPTGLGSGVHEAQVAFNAPYAALRGGKQLSSKIGFFMDKYMDAIYDAINLGK